ncbi:ER membrane protein complex subunit 10 [Toxorhynchites rutilus septentrionalis]|uniref:ER membrane protein complex subunit 10 n=1 Tax=Toxorhynchites rutilus septentrionalis TaxID=329112 RepID=UPI00247A8997|nr:ER membrane protein complex subunit 10 [Toxorhynchites rutilus septentrionalis]
MKILFFTSLCYLIASLNASHLEYDGWLNIELYHALDIDEPQKFTLRGNLTVTNLSAGTTTISQEPLSVHERTQLRKLAEEDRLYRLQAHIREADGSRSKYLTSSKACALAKAQLTDVLWVSLDHSGSVTGVTQSVNNGNVGNCRGLTIRDVDVLDEFNTEVYVKLTENAPIPDTATFIQKLEREREARERGETKDNRGFFAKYWMYIVPVVILVLISGATNPEAAGGQR